MSVQRLPRVGMQAVGDAHRRIDRTAERRSETRTDVGEEFHHYNGVDLMSERMAADPRPGIVECLVCRFGAKIDARAVTRWRAAHVGDLAAADQNGRARID